MIKKSGNKFVVTDSSGEKILGTHESKKQAIRQLQAIEASKAERNEANDSKILSFAEYLSSNA
jgi:hypothetical protein